MLFGMAQGLGFAQVYEHQTVKTTIETRNPDLAFLFRRLPGAERVVSPDEFATSRTPLTRIVEQRGPYAMTWFVQPKAMTGLPGRRLRGVPGCGISSGKLWLSKNRSRQQPNICASLLMQI